MIELLLAGALLAQPAPQPPDFSRTRAAVATTLAGAGEAREVRLGFGRVADYPWLSTMVARQASSSRQWNMADNVPHGLAMEDYVQRVLQGMPEFGALFDQAWRIEGVAVRDVRLKPAAELDLARFAPVPPQARLPYDAELWVTLRR